MSNPKSPDVHLMPQAEGARRLLTSPDGRWIVLEYRIPREAPLTVRLSRSGDVDPIVARGRPSAPSNNGDVYYIDTSADPSAPAPAVYRLGDAEPVFTDHPSTTIHRIDDDRALLVNALGEKPSLALLDLSNAKITARWKGDRPMTGVGIGPSMIYATLDGRMSADPPHRKEGVVLLGLELDALAEAWRAADVGDGRPLASPALEVDQGGKRLVISAVGEARFRVFDAATGERRGDIESATGAAERQVIYRTSFEQPATFLVSFEGPGGSPRKGWKVLELAQGSSSVRVDEPDSLPPRSGARRSDGVLFAPFGKPVAPDGTLRGRAKVYIGTLRHSERNHPE